MLLQLRTKLISPSESSTVCQIQKELLGLVDLIRVGYFGEVLDESHIEPCMPQKASYPFH